MKDLEAQQLVNQIHADLIAAMKAHNQLGVSTLKLLLASFSHAEAVDVSTIEPKLTEVPRNELNLKDLQNIIKTEITELQTTILQLREHKAHTADLEKRQLILSRYLS